MKNFTLSTKVGLLSILLLAASLSASAEGLKGTFFMKAAEFTVGAASAYGNVYADGVEIVIAEDTDPESDWDLTITNLCGQGVTYGGTLSDDDSTLTLSMLGYHYFSESDYKVKGTESLGGADSTIMGSITIELQADGSLRFNDFTVISTIIDGAPVTTALATYKGSVAVPVTSYHFAAATYTAGETSIYGNEYPAEFDFTLRRSIETDNYDIAVTNLCNQGTTFYATANEDNTELTIANVAYAYFSERDYTKGTESLGGADGTMMGNIVMTLQDDGSWAFTDFTVIRTILPPPTFTVLATYKGGKGVNLSGDTPNAPAEDKATFEGTFFMKAAEFTVGAASAYGNVYADGVEIVIAEADPATSWDLEVTNLCGQGVTYGGTLSDDGATLTLSMLGNCYFSDRDYMGKGTESMGGADSTIMGSLEIRLLEDGSLQFSDFTVINTVIAGAPVSTALATYKGSVAVPVTSYHFAAATYTAGETSIYGNEYPAEFDFTLRRSIETDNYDIAVTNLCNQGTTFYATANEDNTELTIANVAYAYFSERDYTKGTESLGGADGTMMGNIVMTLQDDGSWAFTDFTVIRTILPPPTFTVLATYKEGKGTRSETTGIESVEAAAEAGAVGGEGFIAAADDAVLTVFDLSGRKVATGVGRIDGIASGVYIVRTLGEAGAITSKVFVR